MSETMLGPEELQPGMCLDENIVSGMHTILPKGKELTDSDIEYLKKKFPMISVKVHDSTEDDVADELSEEVSEELKESFNRVMETAGSFMKDGRAIDEAKMKEIQQAITEMLEYIQSHPVNMNLLEKSAGWHDYLRDKGMNVFYYTTLLGFELQDHFKQMHADDNSSRKTSLMSSLRPLSTAALFHDIGMVPIQHLFDKSDKPDDSEWSLIKAHPSVAAELLPEDMDKKVHAAIQQHHENFDGSGYPFGLSGEDIDIFSRVIRIADAFSSATMGTGYRKGKSMMHTLYEMINGEYSHCYDPGLLKLFSNIIQPLPVGAKLRLSTGQWGVVVKQNSANPFDPVILIAYDHNNYPIPKGQLEKPFILSQRSDIKVISFGKKPMPFMKDATANNPFKNSDALLENTCNQIFTD